MQQFDLYPWLNLFIALLKTLSRMKLSTPENMLCRRLCNLVDVSLKVNPQAGSFYFVTYDREHV